MMPTVDTATQYPYAVTAERGQLPFAELLALVEWHRADCHRIVTTNGCFDLLHPGHIDFLRQARELGDVLIVGLNSDASVQRLKGPGRPLLVEADRAGLLLALRWVDYIVVFEEALPNAWLDRVRPHIHCKAGDYTADLPETPVVRQHGGEVRILPYREGVSTSAITARMAAAQAGGGKTDAGAGWYIDTLLGCSNLLRQTAYRLPAVLETAARHLAATARAGGTVRVGGEGLPGEPALYAAALAAAMGAAWPGGDPTMAAQPGDVTIVLGGQLPETCQQGVTVITVTNETTDGPAGDVVLTVPTRDEAEARVGYLAIMRVLGEAAGRMAAGEERGVEG